MAEHFNRTRRFERHRVELIAVSIIDELRRSDRVVDLCEEGARLDTPVPLELGRRGQFYFIIPDANLRISCVEVSATVAWAARSSMGLHFDRHLGPIADYLCRLASQPVMR